MTIGTWLVNAGLVTLFLLGILLFGETDASTPLVIAGAALIVVGMLSIAFTKRRRSG